MILISISYWQYLPTIKGGGATFDLTFFLFCLKGYVGENFAKWRRGSLYTDDYIIACAVMTWNKKYHYHAMSKCQVENVLPDLPETYCNNTLMALGGWEKGMCTSQGIYFYQWCDSLNFVKNYRKSPIVSGVLRWLKVRASRKTVWKALEIRLFIFK